MSEQTALTIARQTIQSCLSDITHTYDGPVTRFVAIMRAMRMVATGADPTVVGNALAHAIDMIGESEIPSGEY